ncbi:MAG: Wzz/FepE/Etk N-terminal domain-containing protein, partial [Candidatus Binatia bacterium]
MSELSPYLVRRTVPQGEGTGVFGGAVVEEDERPGVRDYWRVIRKHGWLIATFLFGVVLTAGLIILTMTPIYTAKAMLLIERKAPQMVEVQDVLSESLGLEQRDYYKTQYEILKSRSLAARVIREQGLEKSGLFTGEGREKGLIAGLWASASTWLKGQGWAS